MCRLIPWNVQRRMPHPPLMKDRLFASVKTTMAYRNCIRLGEHLATQAVGEGYLRASNEERRALGMKEIPGRKLRQINAIALTNSKELAVQRKEDASLSIFSNQQRPERLVSLEVLDCTFGGGQHTRELLDAGDPFVRVVALDCDEAVRHEVKEIEEEFGTHRFRFIHSKMSNIERLFGEELFDVVVVDPGPNASQLFDPSRGFLLGAEGEDPIHSDCNHSFDLRYSSTLFKTSALEWLNTEDSIAAATAISEYGLVDFNTTMRTVQALRRKRPLTGSLDILEVIQRELGPLHDDGWLCTETLKRTPMSLRFLISLRAAINSEKFELQRGIDQVVDVLKPDGMLVVFTRYPWELKLVTSLLGEHPHAVQIGREAISAEDVEEFGFVPATTMWTFRKTAVSAAAIRNVSRTITENEVKESELSRMLQLGGTQQHKYPARNFTDAERNFDSWGTKRRERKTQELNAAAPTDINGIRH